MREEIIKAKKLAETIPYSEQSKKFSEYIKSNKCKIIGDKTDGK